MDGDFGYHFIIFNFLFLSFSFWSFFILITQVIYDSSNASIPSPSKWANGADTTYKSPHASRALLLSPEAADENFLSIILVLWVGFLHLTSYHTPSSLGRGSSLAPGLLDIFWVNWAQRFINSVTYWPVWESSRGISPCLWTPTFRCGRDGEWLGGGQNQQLQPPALWLPDRAIYGHPGWALLPVLSGKLHLAHG